jgi:hypothetical protein
MKRSIALTLLVGVALVSAAAPASAGKPVREFLPSGDAVIPGVCDFDLGITVLENNEYITTFFDKEGNITRQHIAGRFVVELRNEETDDSIVANISGPGTITFTDDSTVWNTVGQWLWIFFPGDLGEGEPGMALLTTGQFVVEFGPDDVSILKRRGRQVDVCALLS